MAMLAAPRRKQKVINLRAKNNAWSADSEKFGQRMLEKMGWSAGKGLGAKENGIVEHVVAKYKNDDRGLGFEDRNDQWTKHEDDFNALLANLSNGDKNDEKLHSGVSLEVKSKKSKARVHYHKFTRGKDLTRYSDKDLANIFGKKSLKDEEKSEDKKAKDIEADSEQKFTAKGSMEDYFKNKLAALKSKTQCNLSFPTPAETDDADYAFKGFSGTANEEEQPEAHQGFGFQSFSFYGTNNSIDEKENTTTEDTPTELPKKKKKKKKKELIDEESCVNSEQSENNTVEENECDTVLEQPEKVKKSKKKKQKDELPTDEIVEIKKSKKDIAEEDVVTDYVPKKKKKRKNKDVDYE